jgi:ubiquinone/menaquinone biosynthesis C-methylase UbiE
MKPTFFRRIITRVMRVFFSLLYHQFAWAYDVVAWAVSFGMWKDWVKSVLLHLESDPVLELGFGPGHLQLALHGKRILAFGLDESPQMCALAHRRLIKFKIPSRLVRGNVKTIPFPNDYFRHIVATFPSEYIANPRTLAEVYRVLQPGCNLIILLATRISGSGIHERALAWLYRITGETPMVSPRLLESFQRAGFQPQIVEINHKSNHLIYILAKKIGKI